MFSCEYCRIFKITCFEERLSTAASIRCYFDTINLKQSGFCTIYSFKILVSERTYKNNLRNCELFYHSHIYTVSVIFFFKTQWFYQGSKSENLCFLNLFSVHAARTLDLSLEIMLSPPK